MTKLNGPLYNVVDNSWIYKDTTIKYYQLNELCEIPKHHLIQVYSDV